ncbi:MAG: ABC transporter permease [Hyphomicrobium sp.]|jgi:lipopolysaccharide transport system permease protein
MSDVVVSHPWKDARRLPVRTIRADHLAREAIDDVIQGLFEYEIWSGMALHEIRQRFRRSTLGPLWLTLSMGIMVGALGVVFSTLLKQDISQTLPYIATGLIFWGLLTNCINDGTTAFIGSETYIRNVPLPISVHIYRMIARNLIIWAFNMAIYVVVLVVFQIPIGWATLLFIPGFALFLLNLTWIAFAVAVLSTRYRDIPQVIVNLVQVVFFVTPVFWSLDSLPNHPAFVALNPFYHLLEIVRAPLLGHFASPLNWAISFGSAAVGLAATAYLYRRAYARIAYWV